MLPQFDNTEIAFQYRSSRDLRQARFLFASMNSPSLTRLGIGFTQWAMKAGLPINGLIKNTIFRQFCGGETMAEAAATAEVLGRYGVGVILDYGVEGKEDEAEFDRAVPEFIKAIAYAAPRRHIPFISAKITGFARFALLEQIHAGKTLNEAEEAEWQRVRRRIHDICAAAAQHRVRVLIDAEETWIQEPVNILTNAMMEAFNKEEAIIYNTFQMYTQGALPYLEESLAEARAKGYKLGAKLVRGAYMEKERQRAADMGYADPIQPNKAATDRDYDLAVRLCLDHLDELHVFIGTHNEQSCLKAAARMQELGIAPSDPRVYFSQLYGMSDNISFNLAHSGFNVAKYLPYGPVKDVIPYLMRRAQENTSVKGQTGRELSLIQKEMRRRQGR